VQRVAPAEWKGGRLIIERGVKTEDREIKSDGKEVIE
jgi:hypothetical protein